jgi:ABC-type multidrug transport system permease subunit
MWQLTLSRLKEFTRQPAAIFWVYGFPIIMLLALGTAFRENPQEQMTVDLVEGSGFGVQVSASDRNERHVEQSGTEYSVLSTPAASLDQLAALLAGDPRFELKIRPTDDWRKRLQAGKTDLVIEFRPGSSPPYRFWDEPRRADSRLARYAVEAVLLRSEQRSAPMPEIKHLEQAGSRYIDFLLPGMIGLGLMGGGMWGVGFVVVDMRVRNLLKRFLATPMRRSDFLLAIMFSRLVFTLGDIVILLVFGYAVFQVRCQGSYLDFTIATLLGAAAFAGLGLLVASRAQTLETVSGLMNLVMLPMWIVSGVFFSSERFPDAAQPIINLLPLTALNQLLRAIMLEGQSLVAQWPQTALLAGYAVITFTIALRIFRWR